MKRAIPAIAATAFLLIAFPIMGCNGNVANSASKNIDSTTKQSTTPERTQTAVEYSEGQYQIGKDIPAGGYLFTRDEGEKYLMVDVGEASKKNGENLAVIHQWFTEDKAFLRVSDGQTLEVRYGRFSAVESTPAEPYLAGLYRVGEDIPAGGYLFTRDEGEKYLMIDIWNDFETDDGDLAVFHEWFTEEVACLKVVKGQVIRVQHGVFSAF